MRARARGPDDSGQSYVVIGASTGGIEALSRILKALPADFPGAVLVVVHLHRSARPKWLPDVLARMCPFPVKVGEDGERIRQRVAYIAGPGKHLLVNGDCIRLGVGPPEQFAKPAIDVLFRSAAEALGPRVIGLILTGRLHDGTQGLRAVRENGGITIVQNPDEAEAGMMPRSAMAGLDVDYCLDLSRIGPLLELLVRRSGPLKRGALESGLASSLRILKVRAELLAKVRDQSVTNAKTTRFLAEEMMALGKAIADLEVLVAAERPRSGAGYPDDASLSTSQ